MTAPEDRSAARTGPSARHLEKAQRWIEDNVTGMSYGVAFENSVEQLARALAAEHDAALERRYSERGEVLAFTTKVAEKSEAALAVVNSLLVRACDERDEALAGSEALRKALRLAVGCIEECEKKHADWYCDTGTHCTDALETARAAIAATAPAAEGETT